MNGYVVDASVAAKWVLPARDETLVAEAEQFLSTFVAGQCAVCVPDLFWPEITNLLWKSVARGRLTERDSTERLTALQRLALPVMPTEPLAAESLAISLAYQRSAYDSFYVALAVHTRRWLLTADERLAHALGTRFPVRWLGAPAL